MMSVKFQRLEGQSLFSLSSNINQVKQWEPWDSEEWHLRCNKWNIWKIEQMVLYHVLSTILTIIKTDKSQGG